jgi:hypothetical protein
VRVPEQAKAGTATIKVTVPGWADSCFALQTFDMPVEK